MIGATVGLPSLCAGQATPKSEGGLYPQFPSQDPKRVQEMVGVSHGNVARVRELLAESPELAKATWDGGFGDWETALGAASHVGNREIANLLIQNGARPDIFTFTMFGRLEVVKAIIAAEPGIQRLKGPHGITLLAHARAGGDEAKPVLDYLTTLGDADSQPTALATTPEELDRFVGRFRFGPAADEIFAVEKGRNGALAIKREGQSLRRIVRVEEFGFFPIGAPNVRIRFRMTGGIASSLSLHDPMPLVVAERLPA